MQDEDRTKEQLVEELTALRRLVSMSGKMMTEARQVQADISESEKRFRSIAESATDAIISADSEGRIAFWNHGAQVMFGYEEEEVIGHPLTMLMPEEYREAHRNGLARYIATGEGVVIGSTVELSALRKGGDEFPIELSPNTWTTEDGIFFSGIVRDISERKRAEQGLRDSEERYRQIFAESPLAVFISSPDGKIVEANQAALDLFGFGLEEAIGSDVGDRFADSSDRQRFRRAMGEGTTKDFEVSLLKSDGSAIATRLTATRILDHDGNPLGLQGIVQEASDPRRPKHIEASDSEPEAATQQPRITESSALEPSEVMYGKVEFVVSRLANTFRCLSFFRWAQESGNSTFDAMRATPEGDRVIHLTVRKQTPISAFEESPFVDRIVAENVASGGRPRAARYRVELK